MARKSQLDRDIAEALARTPGTTAAMPHGTSIDTTTTLTRKFRSCQRDALTLAEKARQARGAAARWMKRSSAYAREGEFREADDAQTEATALGQMARDLDAEVSLLRTRSHATMKSRSARVDARSQAVLEDAIEAVYNRKGSEDLTLAEACEAVREMLPSGVRLDVSAKALAAAIKRQIPNWF